MSKRARKTLSEKEHLAIAIEVRDCDERYTLCDHKRKSAYRAFFSHFTPKTITKSNIL